MQLLLLGQICETSKSCEIDPVKLKEGDNVEVNKVSGASHTLVVSLLRVCIQVCIC